MNVAEPDASVQGQRRRGHVFGVPVDPAYLQEWIRRWPQHPLPEDLKCLLLRANGIHLWADLDTCRAYEGLAPLEEWQRARNAMWGEDASPGLLENEYLAISYHTDGAAYWVLKVTTGEYFVMDSCGADETCRIGSDVSALLDWIWTHRIP